MQNRVVFPSLQSPGKEEEWMVGEFAYANENVSMPGQRWKQVLCQPIDNISISGGSFDKESAGGRNEWGSLSI